MIGRQNVVINFEKLHEISSNTDRLRAFLRLHFSVSVHCNCSCFDVDDCSVGGYLACLQILLVVVCFVISLFCAIKLTVKGASPLDRNFFINT